MNAKSALLLAASILAAASTHAATYTFTGGVGGGGTDYSTGANWSGGVVPDTNAGDTAVINGGQAVDYNGSNGDFKFGMGSTLHISNGSWTQGEGGNWIQMYGNASIIVDGGTFNQGTDSNNPFNLNGSTGNVFTISSGVAYFTNNTSFNIGLTYTQSGGTVYFQGNEMDYNTHAASMSGGVMYANLITGVNAGSDSFDFSGGTINLTGATAIYGGEGGNQALNFTTASTGVLNFTGGTTLSTVENMITHGVIDYNGAIDTSAFVNGVSNDFIVTQTGGTVSVTTVAGVTPVPEPSTLAAFVIGSAGLLVLRRRRS